MATQSTPLPPELRKQIEKAERLTREAKRRASQSRRISTRLAKKGLLHWQRSSNLISAQEKLILECIQARDKILEIEGGHAYNGRSFDSEDGLFRLTLTANGKKGLDTELASQAKEKVDRFISEQSGKIQNPEIAELVNLLRAMFASRSKRFSYNQGIHTFLAGDYSHPLLQSAQQLLREAIEESQIQYHLRYFTRNNLNEEWVQVPMNWFITQDRVNQLLERSKPQRKARPSKPKE